MVIRSTPRFALPALLCSIATAACGGSTPPNRAVPPKAEAPVGPEVYDAAGQAQKCEPVQQDCPPVAPDRELLDAPQPGKLKPCSPSSALSKVNTVSQPRSLVAERIK